MCPDFPGTAIRSHWRNRTADVVVELIGGEEGVARELVEASLMAGKHVVTANKAPFGASWRAAGEYGGGSRLALKFEAAAAGGIRS